MSNSNQDLTAAVGRELALELAAAAGVMHHCLRQLSEEEVWSRSDETMNSVGNLMLHLCGNVRQWVISGVGGAPDTHQRQSEFDARGSVSKAELLSRVDSTVQEASEVLNAISTETLLADLTVQGFETTGLGAIVHSVSHFRGHVQEIVHLSRSILGDAYEFSFVPKTPEQGAE
jgi:uncharacterized damage-inducible protein DinB